MLVQEKYELKRIKENTIVPDFEKFPEKSEQVNTNHKCRCNYIPS